MADGSDDPSRLVINLLTELNLHLRDGNCQFFSGAVKVNYADAVLYCPDAFVTCDPRDQEERYVKRYPKLIAYGSNCRRRHYIHQHPYQLYVYCKGHKLQSVIKL